MTVQRERVFPERIMTITPDLISNFDEVMENMKNVLAVKEIMPKDALRVVYDDLREQLNVKNMLSLGIAKNKQEIYIMLFPIGPDDPHEDGGYCEETGVPYIYLNQIVQ